MRHAARAVLAALVWAGLCGSGAQAENGGVTVREVWIAAAPPGAPARAVYAEIYSENGDSLTGAESPAAAGAQIHEHNQEDGVIRMSAPGEIDIPEKSTAVLAPGGRHVMLTGLKQALEEGAEIPVTFIFEHAGRIEAAAVVRPAGAEAAVWHDAAGYDVHAGHGDSGIHEDHQHGGWSEGLRSLWERFWRR